MNLHQRTGRRPGCDGSTVVVVMAIIALLLIYSAANLRTLNHLRGELNLLEERQTIRLEARAAGAQPQPAKDAGPGSDAQARGHETTAPPNLIAEDEGRAQGREGNEREQEASHGPD